MLSAQIKMQPCDARLGEEDEGVDGRRRNRDLTDVTLPVSAVQQSHWATTTSSLCWIHFRERVDRRQTVM